MSFQSPLLLLGLLAIPMLIGLYLSSQRRRRTYAVRFTPRKPNSNWSASNIARVRQLLAEGRMAEAGLATLPESLRSAKPQPRSRGRARVVAS